MTAVNSSDRVRAGKQPTTATTATKKPAKPYEGFLLSAHAAGVWCKKIRGRLHYFGPWNDPDAALKKYLAQKEALHSGKTPKPKPEEATIKEMANAFLISKKALLDANELSQRTWNDYKKTCDLLIDYFGKRRLVTDVEVQDFASLRK
jgi:hypothetical protein